MVHTGKIFSKAGAELKGIIAELGGRFIRHFRTICLLGKIKKAGRIYPLKAP